MEKGRTEPVRSKKVSKLDFRDFIRKKIYQKYSKPQTRASKHIKRNVGEKVPWINLVAKKTILPYRAKTDWPAPG